MIAGSERYLHGFGLEVATVGEAWDERIGGAPAAALRWRRRDPSPRPRRRFQAPLAAALLVASACGSGDPLRPTIQGRWIEEDAEVLFDPGRFTERVVRFEWRLGDPDELSAFRLVNHVGEPRRFPEGVEIPFASPFVKLVRTVDIQARDIHLIELEVDGAVDGHAQLFWSGAGQRASPDRRIQAPVRRRPGDVVVFDVSANPHWSGSIREISFTPTTAPGQTVLVKAVRGIERRLDPAALGRVVARPWKVRLGEDVRNALLGPPGLRHEKRFEIPRGALLRLAFGVWPEPFEPIGFRVAVRTGEEEPVALLDQRLEPGSGRDWFEAELDLASYAGRTATLVLETVAETEPHLERTVPVWANPEILAPGPPPDRPNIVLISIDSLRADRMSAYGHSRATTPGLDAWARNSAIRFETVVAPSPWTLPSHASLFSGLDAVRHGVNYSAPADPSLVTLAERLRDAGYATAAFTAGAYLSSEFGLSQGFDVFRVRSEGPANETASELVDGLAQVRAWLSEPPPRSFFLFFHTYEVHEPYRARQPYFERFGGDLSSLPTGRIATRRVTSGEEQGFRYHKEFLFPDQGRRRGTLLTPEDQHLVELAYDSGVAFMDREVSGLLADLAHLGLDTETVVVFTSDHGEMLGEHGLAAHGYLYDENLLIPLILSLPGGRGAGTVVTDQVRLIDVFPTLLELAGVEPLRAVDGESLLALLDRSQDERREARHREAWSYAASTNYGLSLRSADRSKYIFPNVVWPAIQGRHELYDLDRDPRELDDLASKSARSAALRARAREYLESHSQGLRVRFTNGALAALTGRVAGAMVHAFGVTSPDLTCACLRWEGGRRLSFEVPPGEEFTLHFEQAGTQSLVIEGALAEGGPAAAFRRAVDVGELDRPFELSYDGTAWRSSPAGAEANAGDSPVRIRVWWEGEKRVRGEVPVENEALQEQLRALGYVN